MNLVGQPVFDDLTNLYNKICENPKVKPAKHGSVKLPVIEDRQMRTKVHGVSHSIHILYEVELPY